MHAWCVRHSLSYQENNMYCAQWNCKIKNKHTMSKEGKCSAVTAERNNTKQREKSETTGRIKGKMAGWKEGKECVGRRYRGKEKE